MEYGLNSILILYLSLSYILKFKNATKAKKKSQKGTEKCSFFGLNNDVINTYRMSMYAQCVYTTSRHHPEYNLYIYISRHTLQQPPSINIQQ